MSPTKKVVLLGAPRSGKTSLASRLKFDQFDPNQAPTIGAELYEFEQSFGGQVTSVLLWDTDSELGDKVLDQEFAKGSDAALIVADSTDLESVYAAVAMRQRFVEKFPGATAIIVLNKAEEKLAEKNQATAGIQDSAFVMLCSAKTGKGIRQVLTQALDH